MRLVDRAAAALFLLSLAGCVEGAPSGALAPDAPSSWRVDAGGDLNVFFDCVAATDAAIVSAHRGGPQYGLPENAIETFAATLAAAPAILEVDVAASADGVLFLMHDDTLERTTTGQGLAAQTPWATIAGLKLRDSDGEETAFAPPLLSEALAWAADRTVLQIDFKRSARYEDVVAEVRKQGAQGRVVFIAYTTAQARRLHRLAPEVMISLDMRGQSDLNEIVAGGIPPSRLLAFTGLEAPQPRLNESLADAGVEAIFGTLGGDRSIDRNIADYGGDAYYAELAALGVDIIATDRPIAAHSALEAADRSVEAGECGVSRRAA